MVAAGKLIQKLKDQSLKKSELETLLGRLGFVRTRGRGSHEVWVREDIPDLHIVIATHAKEVPFYQLRQIEKSLRKRGLL